MQKEAASKIIKETFNNSFNKERFTHFVRNLLNSLEEETFVYRGNYIPDAYDDYVKTLERVGKYKDPDGKTIDVLIVNLKKETSLEYARTMQRNFIARYLDGSRGGEQKDAALVAFVSPNAVDWRFSLVKMDYTLTRSESGRVRAEKELTPARRWSFLVGENENSHTAQKQLFPILEDDAHNPALSNFEKAFDIEVVTEEFFEKYRELFNKLVDELDKLAGKDKAIKAEFKKGTHLYDQENISDKEKYEKFVANFAKKLLGQIVFLYFLQKKGWFGVGLNDNWGSGPKDFLRELFNGKHGDYANFFDEILEPLFYEALAKERDKDYYSRFKCRIPFLNGGLFDPLGGYDWVNTKIQLPNELFSNTEKTKQGDKGTGILDVFDMYNFTVKEDEPLEKDVAVDPEMLGNVFEKLLEVKDRKSKGTYYTPREIVHYMCQESLTAYLATELGGKVSKEDIETLIKYGESFVEHDARVAENGKETATYSYKLPESVRKNAKLIDEKLEEIRVCDPAVGSGAFLVGMMSEIVRTRSALTLHLKNKKTRTMYNFKRHAIQNSLYGVDIDAGAVEICKLRLWLSLIVDESEYKEIQPLPNLDYKVVAGNSLLSVEKNSLFLHQDLAELKELKKKYFDETSAKKKEEYKKQIDGLISKITDGHKEFDFEIYFSEVFEEQGGFDAVIANPPYVSNWNLSKKEKEIYNSFESATGHYDIYVLFIERGLQLLRGLGILTYITSNKYMSQSYGHGIRQILLTNTIKQIINFDFNAFDSATVETAILITQKKKSDNNLIKVREFQSGDDISFTNLQYDLLPQKVFSDSKTGYFRINVTPEILELADKVNSESYELSDICYITKGAEIHTSTGVSKNTFIHSRYKKGYKKYMEGKYFEKWFYRKHKHLSYQPDKHKAPISPDIFEAPKIIIKNVVGDSGIQAILDTEGFYNNDALINCIRYADLLSATYPYVKSKVKDSNVALSQNTDLRYLLGIINSRLLLWYFNQLYGFGLHFYPNHAKVLPIKNASKQEQKSIVKLVDKILAITKDDDYLENSTKQAKVREYEKQIDQMVYKLYGLTQKEIEIVETN
ncbi:MAG: N-6 DNA methylase [Candidatus Paceibacterota bacterium]